MLKITIPSVELFDERTNEFYNSKEYELQLEHSLVSISKWESSWHKPFLTKGNFTQEETIDYIRAMTLTQNVDPNAYKFIRQDLINKIMDYIDDPMTATTLHKENKEKSNEVITSELIYYWMITFNIPFECQKWHLNRLLTLIRVCDLKNQPKKKLSAKELNERNRALNAERKAKYKTKG